MFRRFHLATIVLGRFESMLHHHAGRGCHHSCVAVRERRSGEAPLSPPASPITIQSITSIASPWYGGTRTAPAA